MKVWLGKPASANPETKGTCAHVFEEVRSQGGKLLGWHCTHTGVCGQLRRLRVCAHCKAEFGIDCPPESQKNLCENCWAVHAAQYAIPSTPSAKGKSKGGDNR